MSKHGTGGDRPVGGGRGRRVANRIGRISTTTTPTNPQITESSGVESQGARKASRALLGSRVERLLQARIARPADERAPVHEEPPGQRVLAVLGVGALRPPTCATSRFPARTRSPPATTTRWRG